MSAQKPDIRFLLVRHGESTGNVDLREYQRTPDAKVPLTEKGWGQAQAAGGFLDSYIGEHPSPEGLCIFSSPFLRARQTAQGIFNALASRQPVVQEYPELAEQDFGLACSYPNDDDWFTDYPQHARGFATARQNGAYHWARRPEGETRAEVTIRTRAVLGACFREQARRGTGTFILVMHGVSMRSFVGAALKLPYEAIDAMQNPGNCDIRLLQRNENGRLADFGYIMQNGASQEPRRVEHETTQQMFAARAYQWKPPTA